MPGVSEHLKYSESHCWVEFREDNTARVAVTEYGQRQPGIIIFAGLPEKGCIYAGHE